MRTLVLALLLALIASACGESPKEEPASLPETPPIPGNSEIDVSQEAQRVQIGMSELEVIGILGEPRARVGDAEGQRLTFWNFDPQQKVRSRVYVTLDKEGKVVDVQTI